ncbi:MAG: FtsW/RodA/SpoVE family cell cycle protein [Tissierellia bacterium]|nr:FtsW/RodA/SpoVE family cell cycle protein [Tissierellia bacterium]
MKKPDKYSKNKNKYLTTALGLLFLFEILALSLALAFNIENTTKNDLWTCLAIIIITFLSIKLVKKVTKGDNILLLIVNMLFSIGVVMIYRLDPAAGRKQLYFYIAGTIVFYITYFILKNIKRWENHTFFYFAISVLLFLVTLIFGFSSGGAKNWLNIAGFAIQPSEFIKVPFVFFIASFYARYEVFNKKPFGRFFMTFGIYFFVAMFFLQGELGTAIIFFAVMILSQYVYDKDRKLIIFNIIAMFFGAILAYFLFGHVRVRIMTWLDPWSVIDDQGYQITQSLFALASGGLFGSGIGLGRPDYIPVATSDFIFPAICEEMGIFMGIAIVFIFLLLVYRAMKNSLSQQHKFYSILAFCIACLFAIQAFVIFGGVLKLIPLTGVTIPFVSSGGSSMLSGFILLSVLQYTSEDIGVGEDDE